MRSRVPEAIPHVQLTVTVTSVQSRCDHLWHDPMQRPGCPSCARCGITRSAWRNWVLLRGVEDATQ